MVHIGFGRPSTAIVATFLAASLTGCETRTVVYTSPAPRSTTTYVRTPARVVTNTVYVEDEAEQRPTNVPGPSRRLAEPGAPASLPAATN